MYTLPRPSLSIWALRSVLKSNIFCFCILNFELYTFHIADFALIYFTKIFYLSTYIIYLSIKLFSYCHISLSVDLWNFYLDEIIKLLWPKNFNRWICNRIYLSISLCVYLSIYFYLSIYLSIYLFTCLSLPH